MLHTIYDFVTHQTFRVSIFSRRLRLRTLDDCGGCTQHNYWYCTVLYKENDICVKLPKA